MPEPLNPVPLNYVAAEPARPRRSFPLAWFLAACFVAAAVSGILGVLAPKYDAIFKGFPPPLPLATTVLLKLGRWYCHDFGWVAVWTAPVLLATLLMLRRPPAILDVPSRRRGSLPFRIAFLLIALMVGATVLALMLPEINLIDSLSTTSQHK